MAPYKFHWNNFWQSNGYHLEKLIFQLWKGGGKKNQKNLQTKQISCWGSW